MSLVAEHTIREVGVHTVKQYPAMGAKILSAQEAFKVWLYIVERAGWWDPQRETLCSVFTDFKGNVDGFYLASLGGKDSATMDAGLLLRPVILAGSCRLFLFHNHPSGELEPSIADITSTESLARACKLFDIQLMDHLIVGTRGEPREYDWINLRLKYQNIFD